MVYLHPLFRETIRFDYFFSNGLVKNHQPEKPKVYDSVASIIWEISACFSLRAKWGTLVDGNKRCFISLPLPIPDATHGTGLSTYMKTYKLSSNPEMTIRLEQFSRWHHITLPETNIAPENGWSEDEMSFFGRLIFRDVCLLSICLFLWLDVPGC